MTSRYPWTSNFLRSSLKVVLGDDYLQFCSKTRYCICHRIAEYFSLIRGHHGIEPCCHASITLTKLGISSHTSPGSQWLTNSPPVQYTYINYLVGPITWTLYHDCGPVVDSTLLGLITSSYASFTPHMESGGGIRSCLWVGPSMEHIDNNPVSHIELHFVTAIIIALRTAEISTFAHGL